MCLAIGLLLGPTGAGDKKEIGFRTDGLLVRARRAPPDERCAA
jgi:hypothetical protein